MKRIIIFILAAMLAMAISAASQIKFESDEVSFGDIESGKVMDVEFKFENTGDETLVIKNISTSCGCTAPKLEQKEYKPGEKGVLPVKFFSRGYNGKVVKSITVSTNDLKTPYTRLKISGNVTLKDFAALELASDKINFKEVVMGQSYREKVKLKNTGSIDLRIIDVTHSPDVYPVFSKKVLKPEEEAEVEIVFNPMQSGRFATFLKIRSNAYKQRMVIVKVSAEVKDNKLAAK
ncbi:MAG: DUF1573 domain-containing protein [bacterium]|nr:DUF1573 domain-containing protein [bacterium]